MDNANVKTIMELVMHGGNAKGEALKAIKFARKNDFESADKSLGKSNQELNIAHKVQTALLTQEAREEGVAFSLLLVHGQDHLMNAITTRDLAKEIVEILRDIKFEKEQ